MPVPSWSELHFIANSTYATVATVVLGMALLLLMTYGVLEWWRTGRPTLCLCLIGAQSPHSSSRSGIRWEGYSSMSAGSALAMSPSPNASCRIG